jgi:hypothetical protein
LFFIFISFNFLIYAVYVDTIKIPSVKETINKSAIDHIQEISVNPEQTKKFIAKNKDNLINIAFEEKSSSNYYKLIKISLDGGIESEKINTDFFISNIFNAQILSQQKAINAYKKMYNTLIIGFFLFFIYAANIIFVNNYSLLKKILNTEKINIEHLPQFLQKNQKNIRTIYLNSQYIFESLNSKNIVFCVFEDNTVIIIEDALIDKEKFNNIISDYKDENYKEKTKYYLLN